MSSMKVSRPMLVLLVLAVLLTILSFGVRKWREADSAQAVVEGAVPMRGNEGAGPAGDLPSGRVSMSAELLRPSWPEASIDAMASRKPAVLQASADPAASAPTAAPSAPPLSPPAFQLVGRYVDGGARMVFFTQGETLIPARVGQKLPDGFVLKSLRGETVTVIRTADGEKFEMTLEAH